jgi:hypothetical protein
MTVTAEPKRAKTDANSIPTAPRADHHQRARDLRDPQDLVGRDHRGAVHGQPGQAARPRSGRQDHVLRLDLGVAALALHHHGARAFEARLALEQRDLVLLEEVALDSLAQPVDDARLAAHDGVEVEADVLRDDPVLLGVLEFLVQVGGVQERFGGDAAA